MESGRTSVGTCMEESNSACMRKSLYAATDGKTCVSDYWCMSPVAPGSTVALQLVSDVFLTCSCGHSHRIVSLDVLICEWKSHIFVLSDTGLRKSAQTAAVNELDRYLQTKYLTVPAREPNFFCFLASIIIANVRPLPFVTVPAAAVFLSSPHSNWLFKHTLCRAASKADSPGF